jgi:putative membrane protein
MKKFFRVFLIETGTLIYASRIIQGIAFNRGVETILWTGLALTAVTLLVRPAINLLLLPLNIITFGFFKWIGHAVTLYLVTLVVDSFTITGFYFPGFADAAISLPEINLGGGIAAFVGFSLFISLITNFIYWLVD